MSKTQEFAHHLSKMGFSGWQMDAFMDLWGRMTPHLRRKALRNARVKARNGATYY